MPGFDRSIDPATGDYVDDGVGGTEWTRTAAPALFHQIRTPLGSWWADGEAGSRFFELDRSPSSLRTVPVVVDIVRELSAPLVDDGRISEPVTTAERVLDRVLFESVASDLATNEELDLAALAALNL